MAKNNNLTDFLTDTANAIRTKKGTTAKINPQDFSSEIASIQTGTDTSDATATADDILLGKTAYAKGEKLTGTIETYAGEGGKTVNKLAALVDGSLTKITAEDLAGATRIYDYSFYSNSKLKSIVFPQSATSIGRNAFYNCSQLLSITLNNNITYIDDHAFSGCKKITNMVIPDSVDTIGVSSFYDCSSLKNITLPNNKSLNVLQNYSFKGTAITSITIPNSVTQIRSVVFQECKNLETIIIPNSVTSILDSAFRKCVSLTNITIPNGVTSMEDFLFENCSSLTSVTIPDSVTMIANSTFYNCISLISITIPIAVTSIGVNALQIGSTTNKATITMLPTTPPTIQWSTFDASKLEKIIVPAGTGATYKAATNWSNFADYIEEATA